MAPACQHRVEPGVAAGTGVCLPVKRSETCERYRPKCISLERTRSLLSGWSPAPRVAIERSPGLEFYPRRGMAEQEPMPGADTLPLAEIYLGWKIT
jgi:hypothetical protein